MSRGRPTEYTEDLVQKAWDYVDGGWCESGDKVPTVAGLACEIGVHRDTCYDWSKDKSKVFSYILQAILQKQERELVNKGLVGEFVSPIAKMMLAKHGYSDKIENDHTSSDGSMTPDPVGRLLAEVANNSTRIGVSD